MKNNAVDINYNIRFNAENPDLLRELEDMFDNVITEAAQGLDPFLDLGRVIIHHMGLYNPMYVPLRPLKDLTGKGVMENLQNVLKSHENLSLDNSFYLNVGFIKVPKGGTKGKPINKVGGSNDSLRIKRSCIKIQNTDELCLARSICMGFFKLHQHTNGKNKYTKVTKEQ